MIDTFTESFLDAPVSSVATAKVARTWAEVEWMPLPGRLGS
jgi:hypothetical protein